jgi:hypothetical protein
MIGMRTLKEMEGFKIKLKKMKNIHVIPTDKPSRLYLFEERLILGDLVTVVFKNSGAVNQNIYITSDEKIKEGVAQWYLDKFLNKPMNSGGAQYGEKQNVIILTTDAQLIKNGVQAIDDEFLEWFVKNPSCESVRVNNLCYGALGGFADAGYKIIIPKEEPKLDLEKEMFELEQELDIPSHLRWHNSKPEQETLEEAAENHASKKLQRPITIYTPLESNVAEYVSFVKGAKWQQEQDKNKYSEEEVLEIINRLGYDLGEPKSAIEEWFDQFKKK